MTVSDTLLRTLVDQASDGLFIVDTRTGEILDVNESACQKLGYTREELLSMSVPEIDPDFSAETWMEFIETLRQQETKTIEGKHERKDGSTFPVEIRVSHVSLEREYNVVTVRDITERKERERELETVRKRYRTLFRTAPDPVFVADAETGEILEANAAVEEFRGEPREEIIGRNQEELHPAENVDAYRELFGQHVEEGGTKRQLPDGSPIYAVTADGTEIPVEISAETVELDYGPVIYGVFHDISEQLEYERTLTELNEATREVFTVESSARMGRCIVETAVNTLELSAAAVYLLDEDEGVLRSVAQAPESEIDSLFDELPAFSPGDSIAWQVFTEGELAVFDDVREHEDVYNPVTSIRSEIIVPLGEHGVLIVGDTRIDAFDEQVVDLVEILGTTLEAALERKERERRLKNRQQTLQYRTQQLEQLEAINTRIRNITRAIIRSTTRQEIEQVVCNQLIETDQVVFAWIGEVDSTDDRLVPRASAGEGQGYLEDVSLSLDEEDSPEPAVQTAQTQDSTVIENTATMIKQASWCGEAVKRQFQSVTSIPLVYQGTLQGVLTIYATSESVFAGVLQSVLQELCELIANAIVAIERKQSLMSNRVAELEFSIQDQSCFFLRFAQRTNCTIELEEITPKPNETTLVSLRVQDGSPETFLEAAERDPGITNVRLAQSDEDIRVRLQVTEPFIASKLADRGIALQNVSADSSECRITVTVPPTFETRSVNETISSLYPDAELLAKRERMQTGQVSAKLSPRQREVLEMAYREGYFDSPRKKSGGELAADLDISSSAFHDHLRTAERKLLDMVFETGIFPNGEPNDTPQ